MQPPRLDVPLELEPLVGDVVPGEEHACVVAALRPPVADHAHAFEAVAVRQLPIGEQFVEHREQSLLRWRPRLHQVVIEPDLVDRPDGNVGVGVGREQHELGVRRRTPWIVAAARCRSSPAFGGRDTMSATRWSRRANSSSAVIASLPDVAPRDSVPFAVAGAQVARDRLRHSHIVVDGQDDGPGHRPPVLRMPHPSTGPHRRSTVTGVGPSR